MQPIHHAGQQFRTRLGGKAIRPHGGGLHVRDRSPGKVVSRGTCSACLCLCACPARATCCLLPVKLFFFFFPRVVKCRAPLKKKKSIFFCQCGFQIWLLLLHLLVSGQEDVAQVKSCQVVLAGSPSRGGDVTVYLCDITQPSLPTRFTLFSCLFLSLCPFQLYISFHKSSRQLSALSLCSSVLIPALLSVQLRISIKVFFSPNIILCA